MVRDEQHASTNFYDRLAGLLCSEGTEDDWRYGLNRDFSAVPGFWRDCADWAALRGRDLQVESHPRLTKIGQCLTHAVVKTSDRHVLTELWNALGRDQIADLTSDEILRAVKTWNHSGKHLSGYLTQELRGSVYEQRWIAGVLARLAKSWDGRVFSKEGRELIHARLIAYRAPASWVVRWSVGDEPGHDRPFTVDDLNNQYTLRKGAVSYRFGLRSACFLAHDVFEDEWQQTDRLQVGSSYLLIYHPEVSRLARRFAETALGAELAAILKPFDVSGAKGVELPPLPPERLTAIEDALDELDEGGFSLTDALDQVRPRARLVDGLRINSPLSSKLYMLGGPPDLALPNRFEQEKSAVVVVDGTLRIEASGPLPVPLRELGLGEGDHQVDIGESQLTFTLVEPGQAIQLEGSRNDLGWARGQRTCAELHSGAGIRGSLPDFSDPALADWEFDAEHGHAFLAPRHADWIVLIGTQGQIRELTVPPPSTIWTRTAGRSGRASASFTARRSATEGWLAVQVKGHAGPKVVVREMLPVPSYMPPQYLTGQKPDVERWRRFLKEHRLALDTEAWNHLLNSAGIR